MDKEQFKELTKHLLRYSNTLERDILIPTTAAKACEYCPRQVVNQLIVCEPHKLGTEREHFKHKCMSCRQTVYDGSYVKDPRQLRPFSNYTPKNPPPLFKDPTGRKISKNGRVMGRPRKDDAARTLKDPNMSKRAVGRPRKNPAV